MANDTPGERSNASAKCQQSADDMKTIKHTNTLVYYDGVQVFAGQDAVGDHYAGAMIDTVGDADRYLGGRCRFGSAAPVLRRRPRP